MDNPLLDWDHAWKTVTGERRKEIGGIIRKKITRDSEYQLRLCSDSLAFEDDLFALTGKKNY